MTVLAASGDTWGIPGRTFLYLYLAAVGVLALATLLHRAFLLAGHKGVAPERLGPQQVAYLNGGDRLAIYTALGGLRGAGAISMAPDGTLAATGPMLAGATPLDQAVYHAAEQRIRPRALGADPWVAGALGQLREGLERLGLVPARERRRAVRFIPVLILALLVLGVVRLVVGASNGKAVGFLVPLLMFTAWIGLTLLTKVPRRTRAARAALRDLRAAHPHLAPASRPAYATYGVAGAAMGVALYGGLSLWTLDPGFAAGAGISRDAISDSGLGGGTVGASCGGGSSCGGGGSSCGGGGGGGCGG
jgi:uncharacterized protein (TIGR04222 family)